MNRESLGQLSHLHGLQGSTQGEEPEAVSVASSINASSGGEDHDVLLAIFLKDGGRAADLGSGLKLPQKGAVSGRTLQRRHVRCR